MSDTRAGKRSHDRAYKAVIATLGGLRMMGEGEAGLRLDLNVGDGLS
jgi:hypothetical protein